MAGFEGALLGMGNPLLDIINDVDQAFLDKYKVHLKHNVYTFEFERLMRPRRSKSFPRWPHACQGIRRHFTKSDEALTYFILTFRRMLLH